MTLVAKVASSPSVNRFSGKTTHRQYEPAMIRLPGRPL
jgi:hypothetical protein